METTSPKIRRAPSPLHIVAAQAAVASMPSLAMQIANTIEEVQKELDTHGYHIRRELLWKTEFPIPGHEGDKEAAANPFDPQYLAALQAFRALFIDKKAWVHIKAEMQAGKTGVVNTLTRILLIREIREKIGISPHDIFNITGMNELSWKKQTKDRLFHDLADGVEHNKGLTKVNRAIMRKYETTGLRNLMIFQDESHIATNISNQPEKQVYAEIKQRIPFDSWHDNNIRIITVSATDPGKVIHSIDSKYAAKIVLHTLDYHPITNPKGYVGVQMLKDMGRILPCHNLKSQSDVDTLISFIKTVYADSPNRYHIIRPGAKHHNSLIEWLTKAMPGCDVQQYNQQTKPMRLRVADDGSAVSEQFSDINDLLEEEPDRPTFILIKNMFYASKTMKDTFVGILFDRASASDATNLQSLVGRACGYGKSLRTVVFTDMESVDRYLKVWTNLDSNVVDIEPSDLTGRMPGIIAKRRTTGTELTTTHRVANPVNNVIAITARINARIKKAIPCDTFEEAQIKAQEIWGQSLSKRGRATFPDGTPKAPQELLDIAGGVNPTYQQIVDRWLTIGANENGCRAIPTNDGRWCVYGYLPDNYESDA
jgi:hypothetical protein